MARDSSSKQLSKKQVGTENRALQLHAPPSQKSLPREGVSQVSQAATQVGAANPPWTRQSPSGARAQAVLKWLQVKLGN